ncbi:MAG: hypothetical protein ACK5LN_14465 [Propioniciclava sp.]
MSAEVVVGKIDDDREVADRSPEPVHLRADARTGLGGRAGGRGNCRSCSYPMVAVDGSVPVQVPTAPRSRGASLAGQSDGERGLTLMLVAVAVVVGAMMATVVSAFLAVSSDPVGEAPAVVLVAADAAQDTAPMRRY